MGTGWVAAKRRGCLGWERGVRSRKGERGDRRCGYAPAQREGETPRQLPRVFAKSQPAATN
jgi:hypothetical protein